MARANLILSEELKQCFTSALDTTLEPVRWIKATLSDVTINNTHVATATSDVSKDIELLKEKFTEPCFVLFCLNSEHTDKEWVLITYVADDCQVRDKMLYASGRQDIKVGLGSSYFKAEVHVTTKDELTKEKVYRAVHAETVNLPYTDAELLVKEELTASSKQAGSAAATAMGVLPFAFDASFDESVKRFISGALNLLEMIVSKKEEVEIGKLKSEKASDLNSATIEQSDPRFYFVRRKDCEGNSKVYCIFSCPEGSSVRRRMIYATSKATLLAHIKSLGLTFNTMLELSDPKDIDKILLEAEVPTTREGGDAIQQKTFVKPSRPGRGKARIIRPKA